MEISGLNINSVLENVPKTDKKVPVFTIYIQGGEMFAGECELPKNMQRPEVWDSLLRMEAVALGTRIAMAKETDEEKHARLQTAIFDLNSSYKVGKKLADTLGVAKPEKENEDSEDDDEEACDHDCENCDCEDCDGCDDCDMPVQNFRSLIVTSIHVVLKANVALPSSAIKATTLGVSFSSEQLRNVYSFELAHINTQDTFYDGIAIKVINPKRGVLETVILSFDDFTEGQWRVYFDPSEGEYYSVLLDEEDELIDYDECDGALQLSCIGAAMSGVFADLMNTFDMEGVHDYLRVQNEEEDETNEDGEETKE